MKYICCSGEINFEHHAVKNHIIIAEHAFVNIFSCSKISITRKTTRNDLRDDGYHYYFFYKNSKEKMYAQRILNKIINTEKVLI